MKTDVSRLWSQMTEGCCMLTPTIRRMCLSWIMCSKNAELAMPHGSMVVMDDLWHSPATLSSETALQFFENTVITEIDPLQCFQGYYAPYWKMGSFFGFREVSPLMEWVNNNRIDLVFERGVKSVTFEAIHQNHDYSHFAANKDEISKGEEARINQYLAGEQVCKGMGSAFDATWQLTQYGLEQRVKPQYTSQHKELFSKLKQKNWTRKYLSYQRYFEYVSFLNRIQSPSISIVVISWQFCDDIIKNFQILQQQREMDFELIFVNNGGTPGEFDRLKPFIDTYIKLSENTGAYLARNIGAVFAKAPILLFLDDDCLPASNLIQAHLLAFETFDVIAVRGVCLPKTKDNPFNSLAKHYYLGGQSFPRYSDLEGNTSYDTTIFNKIGGWDDEINFGGGGIDLSIRFINIEPDKRKQIYSPEPVIYHDYVRDKDQFETKREKQIKSFERLRKKHHVFDSFQRRWDRFYRRSELVVKKENNFDSAEIDISIEKNTILIDINHYYKLGDLNKTERLLCRYQNLLKEEI